MKFLHAADIHLDSPLAGLAARADLPAGLLRGATRQAFSAMIDLAIAEEVAFVIIAGDLYDGDWKDFSTGLFFAAEMRRLGRPCFLLRGNHDARSVITSHLTLPPNVREFSYRTCETHALPDLGVALHGFSYSQRTTTDDLSVRYRDPLPGLLNIGVLHTSAEDPAGEHDTYAPCSIAALASRGYDYWALGHIHQRRVLHERPFIVFPGNLQGRHAKETGAKGCTLVTVENREIVAIEHRSVDVLRWAAIEVDLGGVATAAVLDARLAEAMRTAAADAEGRPILARVTLTGATPLHGALLGDTERLAAEARAAALAADADLWVEAIRLRTRPPPAATHGDEAMAALRAAFLAALEDHGVAEPLLDDLGRLRALLPTEAREGLDLPEGIAGLATMAEDAWAIIAAALAEDPAA